MEHKTEICFSYNTQVLKLTPLEVTEGDDVTITSDNLHLTLDYARVSDMARNSFEVPYIIMELPIL